MPLSSEEFVRRICGKTLEMVHRAKSSHIGSCLSAADIIGVLYNDIMKLDPAHPSWPGRDRFIISKGHAAAIIYAALAVRGFFPESWLETYCQTGSPLAGHVTHCKIPGVEVSTGSLGHGLGLACGMALAAKADASPWRVFALLSDGECDEGSIWEAALFAPFHKLGQLTAIIDYNKIQSFGSVAEVLDLEPFADKWRAFGWEVISLNGHDHVALKTAFASPPVPRTQPLVVIAHTIKGKGISFMEGQLAWHYKSPDAGQLAQALGEIGCPSHA